jgi:hypothetical protein
MSNPRRHRWFRRTALGLALAAVMVVTGNALAYDDHGFNAAQGASAEADAQADDKFVGAGRALASLDSGSDYAAPEIVQIGYGPGGPPSADARTDDEVVALEPWTPGTGLGCELRGEC